MPTEVEILKDEVFAEVLDTFKVKLAEINVQERVDGIRDMLHNHNFLLSQSADIGDFSEWLDEVPQFLMDKCPEYVVKKDELRKAYQELRSNHEAFGQQITAAPKIHPLVQEILKLEAEIADAEDAAEAVIRSLIEGVDAEAVSYKRVHERIHKLNRQQQRQGGKYGK